MPTPTRREAEAAVSQAQAEPSGGTTPALDGAVADRMLVLDELDRLGQPQRGIIELAFFADLTHAQIAERIGCSVPAVASLLRRGLEDLRSRLT